MTFINEDTFLVTCGMRANSPILIYKVDDCSLMISTLVSKLNFNSF